MSDLLDARMDVVVLLLELRKKPLRDDMDYWQGKKDGLRLALALMGDAGWADDIRTRDDTDGRLAEGC